ncbi:hypothetical protein BGZ74_005637 [Mortierella antarctica]|nr:hypothetical protein BGZ74_005637 [Mortierella antarctica]
MDLLIPRYGLGYPKFVVLPEASDAASGSDGSSAGSDAWIVYFSSLSPKDPIRYTRIDSTSYMNSIDRDDVKEIVTTQSGDLESVVYGDGQLYIIKSTAYLDQALNATRYNRTLALLPFAASYPDTPGKERVIDWNIACGFGDSLAKAAKGKLYYICLEGNTTSNRYIFDSKSSTTRGPFRLNGVSAIDTKRSFPLTLAHGSSVLEEPQFAIFQLPAGVYAVDVYSANGTSANLTSILESDALSPQGAGWTCRTKEQDEKVVIAGALSGTVGVVLLVYAVIWRRRRRVRRAGKQGGELELSGRDKDGKVENK